MKAVVLLSGGIDSSTTCAIAKDLGYQIYALTVLYGQVHKKEIEAAKRVSKALGVNEHKIIEIPTLPGSPLTGEGSIPNGDLSRKGVALTFVPARNIILLSLAANYAHSIGSGDIFIGANSVDFSGYPDCREQFIEKFEKALSEGMGEDYRIHSPIINMTKGEIIVLGTKLGVDYSLTTSCYRGGELACGKCDSCLIRLKGFSEAGIKDPIKYIIS